MKPLKKRANNSFAKKATPQSYTFDYMAEVTRFQTEFPSKAGEIHFVDMTPTSATALSTVFNDAAKVQKEVDTGLVATVIAQMQGKGQSFTITYRDQKFVVVDRAAVRKGLPRLMGQTASNDIENLNTVDHEIGHRVTDAHLGKEGGQNRRECAADAYAALRYIQRFDDVSQVADFSSMRAVELVFRADHGDHFTTPVLDAIVAKARENNEALKVLTPEETAEVATALADALRVSPEGLQHLREQFTGHVGKLQQIAGGDMEPLRDLALDLLTTSSPAAYQWGSRAFTAMLDGKVNIDGVQISPKGAEWDELRADIAARAPEFAKKPSLPPAPK